ncbi:unnamed protein product [Cuscuta campestris]|uniref:Retrotransposon gag domain-containing protein n=1 Tax=Cuscuta campestris TaxID=132261 RepID=A0A484L561_9ASTE|nr:unnamed protein product [Cuscuta campestris]
MTSNVVSTDVFREFQSQIDGQIQSHTAAMQQINQAMQQLQRDLKTLLTEKRLYEGPHLRRDTPDGFVGPANSMTKLKLDMPKCDGTDPLGWLFKVHEYFSFYAVPEESRLSAVCLMLEGQALDWFRWRQRNNLLSSWTEFVTSFKLRFDPLNYVDYFGLLSKVRQTGTVLEYQQAFEKILVNVTGVEESNLQSLFHAGLKTHLQHELMLLKPSSLSESFALARELETKHAAWATSLGSRPRPTLGPFNKTPAQPLLPLPGAQQPEDKTATTPPIQRLTYAEKKERDAKGLCYNCDEKWSKCHRCGRFLLLLEDDEEDLSPGAVDETLLVADVSTLNSMAGVTAPRSLRLSGMIAGGVVDVLIDSGSTHNFVHPRVVERLQLPVDKVTAFRVYVGNGASLLCDAQCKDVELLLQGVSFSVDVFVLPIHGPDVVLGVQWLRLLGKVTHDYANLTMDFCWKGSQRSLRELLQQVIQTPDQQFYIRKLMGYRFRIEYKPGRTNVVADALSRQHLEHGTSYEVSTVGAVQLFNFSQPLLEILARIRAENETEPDLVRLHELHRQGSLPAPFSVMDGILFYQTRMCVGAASSLRMELLREYHDSPIAGHTGVHRTFTRLAATFYWPSMCKDVRSYVGRCEMVDLLLRQFPSMQCAQCFGMGHLRNNI